jgi:hypothetical protein
MAKKQNKKRKISGWFISWFGTSNKIPSDEWDRIIFINQNGRPDKPEPILDFIEKYYISTRLYLSEKISLRKPKARESWREHNNKYAINYKKNTIIYGDNPCIVAEYRKNVLVPDRDYPTWFPK